jgi:hypothetical protein
VQYRLIQTVDSESVASPSLTLFGIIYLYFFKTENAVYDSNKFISIVQMHPTLWDNSDADYADKMKTTDGERSCLQCMETKKCRVERKHEVELTVRGWRPIQESEQKWGE